MKLFPQHNDMVLYNSGFEDDLLNRKALSKQLSALMGKIEDPIVLALDGKWGSGKTFFLKRWVSSHIKDNSGTAKTVYFDAFESDYLSDPLVSIIAAVCERFPSDVEEETLKKWKTAATKLVKPAFGVALSLATFGAKQYLDEMGDVIADAFSSEGKTAADGLWEAEKERKDAVLEFKSLLTELADKGGAPIVIVVDELDRCRPDYSLSVLEVIKHFFSVPKVHFILGANLNSLENSVKARYGADVDAEGYLRKFINISFSLPRFLGTENNVDAVISYASQMSTKMDLPDKISGRCIKLLECAAQGNDVSLRDVEKILSKIALVPSDDRAETVNDVFLKTLCVLLVSSVVCPKFHKDFISTEASFEDIMRFLGATKAVTSEDIDGKINNEYDENVTDWLVLMGYCCCPASVVKAVHLPAWKSQIGNKFSNRNPDIIPKNYVANIQKDYVDLFKL